MTDNFLPSQIPETPLAQGILRAYSKGQEDELLEPHLLVSDNGEPVGRMANGDAVIFYDIRGEREIELTRSLTEREFPHFRIRNLELEFCTMIRYQRGLDVCEAFPPTEGLQDTLVEVVSNAGLKVVKITEAEKAIHLAYFLNGKREQPFDGETRIVVPTRKDVVTFDQSPEMSADQVVQETCRVLDDPSANVVIVNLCNVDVVGHFENRQAVLKAIETTDDALGQIIEAARRNNVVSLVTADHGTVEEWLYPGGAVNTGHTANPVPFMIDGLGDIDVGETGELSDISPTMLDILGIKKPEVMTGSSLITDPVKSSERILLLILDGWGYRDSSYGNMIVEANTPQFDSLWRSIPHSLLTASGLSVGMPEGSVGNSEVGHLHIGSGRTVLSDRVRIDKSITDGSFMKNQAFLKVINEAKRKGSTLHLLGILSFYSSHGSLEHLRALMKLCKQEKVSPVYIHAMLGRRGEKPQAGARYMGLIEQECVQLGVGQVAGVIGRYWSLDREENWDRIEKTYRWLVEGKGVKVPVS